jgi:hypothetical protein
VNPEAPAPLLLVGTLQRELDGLLVAACAEDVAPEPLVDLGYIGACKLTGQSAVFSGALAHGVASSRLGLDGFKHFVD